MSQIVLPHGFEPRPYQVPFMRYLDRGGKRAICIWHRRGGKDLVAAHQTCKMMHRRRGAYWHVFPTAEQGKKALWEGFTKDGQRIMEQVFPTAIRKSPREWHPKAEMVVELKCGSIWRLVGSDKVSLVGAGPVGVVFSEYAIAKPSAWNFIAPMLDENSGWASFISTPRGNNHCKRLFDAAGLNSKWYRDLKTLYDTRAYDPDVTIAEARARGMPEALVQQEYLCDWTAALVGSVWGELLETLDKSGALGLKLEPGGDEYVTFDLGGAGNDGDATSMWIWRLTSGGVDFLDHHSAHGKPLSYYIDWLEARAKQHGYTYSKLFIPHDSRAKTLVTGSSTLEALAEEYGSGRVVVCPRLSLADGIEAGRWLLQQPVRFDERCDDGVESLKAYHYAYDEETSSYSNRPMHDESSHDADAFRYVAIVVRAVRKLVAKPANSQARMPETAPTLDELWKSHDNRQGSGRI